MTTIDTRPEHQRQRPAVRRLRLIKGLAVTGAVFVVYQLWGFAAWLMSDDVRSTFDAPAPARFHDLADHSQLSIQLAATAWLAYVAVDLIRRRTLTWPVLITAAWSLTWWQESLANVTGDRFAYNSAFFDRGDWTPHLPFVSNTGYTLPQPLAMEPFVFVAVLPVLGFLCAALMRGLRRITGVQSPWVLACMAWALFILLDVVVEARSISQGMHSYPRLFGALSIHAGTPKQFPLYEALLLGLMWALPGIVMFFLRDVPVTGAATTPPQWRSGRRGAFLTVLAGAGALNTAFLAYNLIAFVFLPGDTTAPMPPWLAP